MKLDGSGTRFNAFFQTNDANMRKGTTPTNFRRLQSAEMGKMKIHIPAKSFEQFAPNSPIMGDAKPRKLKSCKGLSGFMLAETFRSPDPTNLELQPPPVHPPEKVSASQETSGYTSARSSRVPSVLALGAYIDSGISGRPAPLPDAPLPDTGRYPRYLRRTEEQHPRVAFRYCENPPSQSEANPHPSAPYWSHPIPPAFRCPACLIKVATIVFPCYMETELHGCCTDCAALGCWCSMCQRRADVLSTLKLTALAENKGGEELSVGQIVRGNSILWGTCPRFGGY